MNAARDLARVDPWQKSLERSLQRRGRSNRRPRPSAGARRLRTVLRVGALLMLGGLAAASASGFRGAQASRHRLHRDAVRNTTRRAAPSDGICRPTVGTAGYTNPLADARVRPERVDQGVDYAGSGTLIALGSASVTYVGTIDTGWPGAFIEYRLLGGADAGCYVYYAEGVIPLPGLHAGQTIGAGEPIATIIHGYPTGTEVGWGAGSSTKSYARATGDWSPSDDQDSIASASGKSFSALIAALGGPPGVVEG